MEALLKLASALVLFAIIPAKAQNLAGYQIVDYLVSADHPNGCTQDYVTGLPDDSTWVNFSSADKMTGKFGFTWTDTSGNELLLETSYHPDNYTVSLKLSNGLTSAIHQVDESDWIQIADTPWQHLTLACVNGVNSDERYILPLDFGSDFGLGSGDSVSGIEITFLGTVGAPDLAGIYIIHPPPPCDSVLDLGRDTTLCYGDSLVLNLNAPYGFYAWQDGSIGPSYTVKEAGIYVVEMLNACDTLSDTIVIKYREPFTVDIGMDTSMCPGTTVIADITGSLYNSVQWNDGSNGDSLVITSGGHYFITARDSAGCIDRDTLIVNEIQRDQFSLGNDTVLCQEESMDLEGPVGFAEYNWSTGEQIRNITIAPINEQISVWLEVLDDNGCRSADSIVIAWEACPELFISTAFSPNQDGINDYFTFNLYGIEVVEVDIYNRWGNRVYRSSNINPGWNGMVAGRECPTGVYAVLVRYRKDGEPTIQVYQGNLTLLR